jgi:LysM repeat protein
MAIVNLMIPHRKDKGGWVIHFTTGDGKSGSLGRSPAQFEFSNVYGVATMEREGQKPITRPSSPALRSLKFSHVLFHNDYTKSIEPFVAELVGIGARGTRIRFSHGSPVFENGRWWHIQALNVKVIGRALDNSISRVMLEWDLLEYIPVPNPASTVKKPAPPRKPVVRVGTKAPVARYYRVARGDSLWSIAARMLGNGLRWQEIYRLNTGVIRSPSVISPGMNLKLPAR